MRSMLYTLCVVVGCGRNVNGHPEGAWLGVDVPPTGGAGSVVNRPYLVSVCVVFMEGFTVPPDPLAGFLNPMILPKVVLNPLLPV